MESNIALNLKEQIDREVSELKVSDKLKMFFNAVSNFQGYSYGNVILITRQFPDATHILGVNSWQNQFNRKIKDESREIMILAPEVLKKPIVKTKRNGNGELILDENNKTIETREELIIPYMKPVSVFDVTQTDGKILDLNSRQKVALSPDLIANGLSFEFRNINRHEWDEFSKDGVEIAAKAAISYVVLKYYNFADSENDLKATSDWICKKNIPEVKRFLDFVQKKSFNAIMEINSLIEKQMKPKGVKQYGEHTPNI